jgi:hypothetical protein
MAFFLAAGIRLVRFVVVIHENDLRRVSHPWKECIPADVGRKSESADLSDPLEFVEKMPVGTVTL